MSRKQTDITKEKLRSLARKEPVVQMTITGRLMNVFESVSDAARKTSSNRCVITRCCRSHNSFLTARGCRWRYLKDVDIQRLMREAGLTSKRELM